MCDTEAYPGRTSVVFSRHIGLPSANQLLWGQEVRRALVGSGTSSLRVIYEQLARSVLTWDIHKIALPGFKEAGSIWDMEA